MTQCALQEKHYSFLTQNKKKLIWNVSPLAPKKVQSPPRNAIRERPRPAMRARGRYIQNLDSATARANGKDGAMHVTRIPAENAVREMP